MANKKSTKKSYVKNSDEGFFDKVQNDLEKNNSFLNLVLGTLIIVVLGILVFNYFNKPNGVLGPSVQTDGLTEDVSKESLPGKYTVKEGDTLFLIAQNYYDDGFKYPEIVAANQLADENKIEAGQVLEVPRLKESVATIPIEDGIGGAENQTIWGEKITSDTYTVMVGDWLSTIAGRAYGDIYMFDKIAKANNLSNPDSIEVGMTLKLPR